MGTVLSGRSSRWLCWLNLRRSRLGLRDLHVCIRFMCWLSTAGTCIAGAGSAGAGAGACSQSSTASCGWCSICSISSRETTEIRVVLDRPNRPHGLAVAEKLQNTCCIMIHVCCFPVWWHSPNCLRLVVVHVWYEHVRYFSQESFCQSSCLSLWE